MKFAAYILVFVPFLSVKKLTASPYQIHCPKPETITYTAIPHSIHGFYTAESDAVGFWGMAVSILNPKRMALAKAEVGEVNDYWNLVCVYGGNGLILNMEAHSSAVFRDCHFPDGSQSCEGSIADCVLSCPELPQSEN